MRSRLKHRAALVVAATLVLTSCGGGDDSDEPSGSPAEVLAAAKAKIDETPGVGLALSTEGGALPSGVSGVLAAEGTLTHQPAFEGSIEAVISGFSAQIPVVAVDDTVYADIPLLPGGMQEIDPDDYAVPDPAAFADPDTGLSAWLVEADKPTKTGSTREGGDVLTVYRATLPGSAVASVIPTADASGSFDARFNIADDGTLRSTDVTGPFYKGDDDVTYLVTLSDYGIDKQITAP